MSANVTLHAKSKKRPASAMLTPERPAKAGKAASHDASPATVKGVSPLRHTEVVEVDSDDGYRQHFYESTVQFGAPKSLSASEEKVLQHIKANYTVPKDFTVDKQTYGPLGGQSMEERLLVSYRNGSLPLKKGKTRVLLCTECAQSGHKETECPSVFA